MNRNIEARQGGRTHTGMSAGRFVDVDRTRYPIEAGRFVDIDYPILTRQGSPIANGDWNLIHPIQGDPDSLLERNQTPGKYSYDRGTPISGEGTFPVLLVGGLIIGAIFVLRKM